MRGLPLLILLIFQIAYCDYNCMWSINDLKYTETICDNLLIRNNDITKYNVPQSL